MKLFLSHLPKTSKEEYLPPSADVLGLDACANFLASNDGNTENYPEDDIFGD